MLFSHRLTYTIYDYFCVDLSIVWRIITKNLPETKQLIVNYPRLKRLSRNQKYYEK